LKRSQKKGGGGVEKTQKENEERISSSLDNRNQRTLLISLFGGKDE